MDLNTVTLHGRLTDTPRLSHTNQHHLAVANTVIAHATLDIHPTRTAQPAAHTEHAE